MSAAMDRVRERRDGLFGEDTKKADETKSQTFANVAQGLSSLMSSAGGIAANSMNADTANRTVSAQAEMAKLQLLHDAQAAHGKQPPKSNVLLYSVLGVLGLGVVGTGIYLIARKK